MKRCPECRRDYYDETLLYCLDDGSALLDGPARESAKCDESTAILPELGTGAISIPPAEPNTAIYLEKGIAIVADSNSIAVLPFVNISSDVENEYFCDGLAEELLNALSKIENLKVAARTSAFLFKGKNINVSEIGEKLSVKYVLEGSVRKSGNRLRITVQLVNAADGYHLWAERYDCEMDDIFDVQDEITLAVVESLKVKLFGQKHIAILKKGTENPNAFEFYLRGRALWNRRTREDFHKAIQHFESAVELDPNYAFAYAGLTDTYASLAYFDLYAPSEMAPKAHAAVEKAIEIDPSLSECHTSLAVYKLFFEFDFSSGEREYRNAIAINPKSALPRYWLCSLLAAVGRTAESLVEGRAAMELDPLSPIANFTLARALCCAGQYEEAIELSIKNFELLPDFYLSHLALGWAYQETGKLDDAVRHFRKASMDGGLRMYGYLGKALVRAGRADESRALLNEMEEQAQHQFISPIASAVIYAELGDMVLALDLLEKAWSVRAIHLIWSLSDAIFDVFRSEPRFVEVMRRMNLTQ
ncbi:MAG: hypothetical protein ABI539_08850 [Acidobacteriota bacterium]